MANWGGLNNALNAWRNAYNKRLPGRGTASDGARADAQHGSSSQHQSDSDGTTDANDMDVNVLGSSTPTGTADELRIIEAMKLDFERDPHGRGHLWIHRREIAQHNSGNWTEHAYGGASPHTEHVHWESRQDHEDDGREWPMPETDRVLAAMGLGSENDMMLVKKGDKGESVKFWQHTLNDIGFSVGEVDGEYGPKMEAAVNRQRNADGVGPLSEISGWGAFAILARLAAKRAGKAGAPGKNGTNGQNGAPGLNGKDGAPGKDGKDGALTGALTVEGGTLQVRAE